ncbi:ATPase family gene 2 protein homolog B-like [Artemia franciscana]|uniref:SEA domain-containing protein n=1 Tax=Artemia franciscana TaxID=6661 RepID=A0AA88I1A4_ARTSF|nr:hypothetical protein QYM36_005311 [Artemia franciscana]KAK2719795.1 hypothetical protein QYM36_005311 [Artemia franciscana]
MLKILNGSDCLILSPHRYVKEQALFSRTILGSYFVVKVNVETQFICKVFVDETLCSNYALIGNMVTQTLCKNERSISNFSLSERCEKVILTQNLKVNLIFRSVGHIRKWKGNFRQAGLIQQIMSGFIFKEDFYLTIRHQPIAKQNGLDFIYIKETEARCQFCKINSSTRIEIVEMFLFDHIMQHICLDKHFIPGVDAEVSTAINVIDSAFNDSKRLWKGILLWGPSGCGREILPLEIAKRKCMYLMEVKCDSISSSYVGESENKLKEILQNAKDYSQIHPVVLFIENVESICPKWTSASMHRRRIASQLLSGIDSIKIEDRVFVIGSSEYPGGIEPLLRRHGRLDKEIYVGMPTIEARYALLEHFMEELSLNKAIELDFKEVAEKLVGYNRNDIERLVGTVSLEEKTDCICKEDFLKAMHTVGPSLRKSDNLGIVDHIKTLWNEVGGLERAKLAIKKAVEWPLKYPEAFARFGIPKPKGILLYGPPGCGKSLLVRAAATECNAAFLSVKASEIFSCFVGDSEKLIASLFSKARLMAPCILFLDELDSIVGSRESAGRIQSTQQGIISTLLQEVDGITATSASICNKELEGISDSDNDNKTKIQLNIVPSEGVILIGATNQPDKIDSALLRPGRLDTHVYVPPPDFPARIDILKIATKVMPLHNVDIEKIADLTDGYSGADLKLLCKEAGLIALSEDFNCEQIDMKHFEKATENVRSSISVSDIQYYESYSNR